MKHTAVICEYNPYHNGHLWQHDELVRRGAETVTGILGASFSQRGEPYLLSAWARAAQALCAGGCDAVFSLPSPFSASGAQYFAAAGVSIASRLGYVDTLAFGCECTDENLLRRAAERLAKAERNGSLRDGVNGDAGTPRAIAKLYADTFGENAADVLTKPNNALAIAYLKALERQGSPLDAVILPRVNVCHDGAAAGNTASSTFLRAHLDDSDILRTYMPETALAVLLRERENGNLADISLAERVILDRLRTATNISDCAEAGGGLGNRIQNAAEAAGSLSALYDAVATKGYTNAKVRRAVLSMLLGVTEEDETNAPSFTMLLAANRKGLAAFRGGTPAIPVVSCPADLEKVVGDARAVELTRRAEELYAFCTPKIQPSGGFRLNRPTILGGEC